MKVFLTLILGLSAALSTVTTNPVNSTEIDVFDQLDDYSFLSVADYLQLKDLIVLASLSPRYCHLTLSHFIIPKLNSKTPKLRITLLQQSPPTICLPSAQDDTNSSQTELCFKHDRILTAVKVLCPIASHLDIKSRSNYRFNEEFVAELASYVSQYCADVPQSVELLGVSSFAGPFQFAHAKNVHIQIPHYFEHFNLARAFPRVEHLKIDTFGRFTLPQHFPNLTHFQLHNSNYGNFDLQAFAERNPQIRSAELQICGQIENIDEVSRLFPHLETLSLKLGREPPKIGSKPPTIGSTNSSTSRLRDSVDSVRFRNVKKFTLDLKDFYGSIRRIGYIPFTPESFSEDNFTAIMFDQLKSFKYVAIDPSMHIDEQIDFIARYKDVKSVEVSGISLEYPQLQRLIDELPILNEIILEYTAFESTLLTHLMAASPLQSVTLKLRNRFMKNQLIRNLVLHRMPDEWVMYANDDFDDYSLLTFKRIPMN